MAQKPDGKGARTERVTFTRPAADRIAKVVRKVEAGNRDLGPFAPSPRLTGSRAPVVFRICTFTGSWSVGSSKTVTFKNQPTTPNTGSASNLFWPVPEGPERDCAIGKDGTAWYLIMTRLYAADAATAAVLTAESLEFKTIPVAALATHSTMVFSVSVTTCSTAAT